MTKRVALVLLCAVSLCGCKKEEEVPVETEPPYLAERSITFNAYGESVQIELESGSAFKAYDNASAVIYPDTDDLTREVEVFYVEGNSLNDFAECYRAGVEAATKSEIKDNGFTADDRFYYFEKSESNLYLIATGNEEDEEFCRELIGGVF